MINKEKFDIKSLDFAEVTELAEKLGGKKFNGKQIYDWLHVKHAKEFDDMTNISKAFRQTLADNCYISKEEIVKKLKSKVDGSIKYLFRVDDRYIIESVFMKHNFGNSVCLSTQVGCKMGCAFCASGLNGFEKNLTTGEMLSQVYEMADDTKANVNNIVLMGSGEPLDNYDNVVKFIDMINSEKGANIGQRHITLSTCGIIPKIYKLAERKLQITLAISLHAPNDTIRKEIVPIAKTYPFDDLLKACSEYTKKTKRRITFEYALIDGVNDKEEHAQELSEKLKGMLCHVNLIPMNPIEEKDYNKSSDEKIEAFKEALLNNNIETTIRRSLGSDIAAACGQLRNDFYNKGNG